MTFQYLTVSHLPAIGYVHHIPRNDTRQVIYDQAAYRQVIWDQAAHSQVIRDQAAHRQVIRGQAAHRQVIHGQAAHRQGIRDLASYPGSRWAGERESLVSTVCACA